MVMEIASAFGPVSSCYCESNAKQPFAILEYVDQLIIPKACAGLNGMKLGGQVLTVVKAVPSTSSLRTTGNSLRCDIPDHARPLLEQPTQVIKLKNVVTRESLTTLSEFELEEVLEDVRTECARFGSIKSVNIVKFNCSKDAADSCETNGLNGFLVSGLKSGCDKNDAMDNLEEATDKETRRISGKGSETNPDDQLCQSHVTDVPMQQLECGKMSIEDSADFANQINPSNEASHCQDNDMAPENHLHDEKTCRDGRECQDEKIEDIQSEMEASENLLKCHDKNSSKDYSETPEEKNADAVHNGDFEMKDITAKSVSSIKGKVDENSTEALARDDSEGKELALTGVDSEKVMNVKCESKKQDADPEHIFEPGSIFVEYKRTEASSMAAHCLHGRQFDGQPVMVEYVPLDRYRARFSK